MSKELENVQSGNVSGGNLTDTEIGQEIQKMNLPSNSNVHKYNEESNGLKKRDKVISGKAVVRKKSLGKKFAETFLAEDIANVKDYLFYDVIVPAIKDTIVNTITNGIQAFVYGGSRSQGQRFTGSYGVNRFSSGNSYTSYSNRYGSPRPDPAMHTVDRGYMNDKEPILETRYDAEVVLDDLRDLIASYGQATVGDLYDLLGFDSKHTDYKWGWVDLGTAQVRHVYDGWLVDLPRPVRV